MIFQKLIKCFVLGFAALFIFHTPLYAAGFDVSAYGGSAVTDQIQWHGYTEFEFWKQDNANDYFDAHKVVVWMGVPVNEKVFFSSEVEYEHLPRLADSGTQRNGGSGEINLDSAQIRVTPVEDSTFYGGVFYVPFGIEIASYPGQKNKLITRPKVMKSGGVIPGTWSDVGIAFNQVFLGVGQIDLFYINGDAKNGGIASDNNTGGNAAKSVGTRLMLDGIHEGLNFGASYVRGKYDPAGRYYSDRLGVHLRVDLDRILGVSRAPVFIGEYVKGSDEKNSSVSGKDRDVSGFYTQVSSRVLPFLEIAARYGQYDNDEEKKDNGRTETSFGVVLHPYKNFQFKAEYQLNGEDGPGTDNDTLAFQVVAHW